MKTYKQLGVNECAWGCSGRYH